MKRMITCDTQTASSRVIESWKHEGFLDEETSLRSDHTIRAYGYVDNIYIQFDRAIEKFPKLAGYAHNDIGQYKYEYLTADDITNYDLHQFMNDDNIVDLEGMLTMYPGIVYD